MKKTIFATLITLLVSIFSINAVAAALVNNFCEKNINLVFPKEKNVKNIGRLINQQIILDNVKKEYLFTKKLKVYEENIIKYKN